MKKILVPVDYSDMAINAMEYALTLDIHEEKELIVFHVYSGLLDMNEPVLAASIETKKAIVLKSLKEFVAHNLKWEKSNDCKVLYKVVEGNPVQEIIKETETGNYALSIMGTRDKYDIFDKWLGTISLGVSKKSRIPLLLIPNNAKFSPYRKMLVASDHNIKDHQLLNMIREWNEPFKAFIKFLHIAEREDDGFQDASIEIVKDFFEGENEVDFGFEIVSKHSINVGDSILNSAYQSGSDIVIIIPKDQSYLSSLVFKSVTKEMILKSVIPVLFLHKTEDS